MRDNRKGFAIQRAGSKGFSTVELVVVVAIMVIISGTALPYFMQIYRIYQLDDAAAKMADILKRTRFEAVRGDLPALSCRTNAPAAATTQVWSDTNNDTVAQPGESQVFYVGPVNLIPGGGVPNTGALAAAVGQGAPVVLNAVSPTAGFVTFDQRGAATAPVGINVFYLTNTALTGTPNDLGYRAVILLPSGSVQIWKADPAGNWVFMD